MARGIDLDLMNAPAHNGILLHASNQEAAALMRHIASNGFKGLAPDNCTQVAEFIIEESVTSNRCLDLRLLMNFLGDRLQWERDHTEAHWGELVSSRLRV